MTHRGLDDLRGVPGPGHVQPVPEGLVLHHPPPLAVHHRDGAVTGAELLAASSASAFARDVLVATSSGPGLLHVAQVFRVGWHGKEGKVRRPDGERARQDGARVLQKMRQLDLTNFYVRLKKKNIQVSPKAPNQHYKL